MIDKANVFRAIFADEADADKYSDIFRSKYDSQHYCHSLTHGEDMREAI